MRANGGHPRRAHRPATHRLEPPQLHGAAAHSRPRSDLPQSPADQRQRLQRAQRCFPRALVALGVRKLVDKSKRKSFHSFRVAVPGTAQALVTHLGCVRELLNLKRGRRWPRLAARRRHRLALPINYPPGQRRPPPERRKCFDGQASTYADPMPL